MVCDPNAIALASCSQQHHPSPTTTPKVNRHAGHAYCCPRPHKDLLAKSQVCVEGLVLSVKLRLQWHDSHIQELSEDRVSVASDTERPPCERIACRHHQAIATSSCISCSDMEASEDNRIYPGQR